MSENKGVGLEIEFKPPDKLIKGYKLIRDGILDFEDPFKMVEDKEVRELICKTNNDIINEGITKENSIPSIAYMIKECERRIKKFFNEDGELPVEIQAYIVFDCLRAFENAFGYYTALARMGIIQMNTPKFDDRVIE